MTIDPQIIIESSIRGAIACGAVALVWVVWRFIARRIRRGADGRSVHGPWFSALFLPLGCGIAHWLLISPPRLTGLPWSSVDGNSRIFLIAPLAMLLGLLCALRMPRFVRALLVLGAGLGVGWAIAGTVHPDYLAQSRRWMWVFGTGIGALLSWWGIDRAAEQTPRIGILGACALAGITAPVVGILGANAVYAQGATVLSGMLGGLFALSLWPGGASIARGGTPLVVLLLVGYWVIATVDLLGDLPVWAPALLVVGMWLPAGIAAGMRFMLRRSGKKA